MECERIQAEVSARHDGEASELSDEVLDGHLALCQECRSFVLGVEVGPRGAPIRAHDPSLPGRIAAAAGDADRARVWWALRALLLAVATGYLLTAVPELVGSSDAHHGHLASHLGAFEIAYGVGLAFVAVRPSKARAMVPFTAALAVGMGVVAIVDIARGNAFPLGELSHLLEVAGLVLVWLLATRNGWPDPTKAGTQTEAVPRLSVAPDPRR